MLPVTLDLGLLFAAGEGCDIVADLSTGRRAFSIPCTLVKDGRRDAKATLQVSLQTIASYRQANGPVRAGDGLEICLRDWRLQAIQSHGSAKAYLLLESDTLHKAPPRHSAKAPAAKPQEQTA